jgi:hypothetical protein
METQTADLEARMEMLERKTQQLADLLAGLAQVTQQLMEMNHTVLEAAKEVRAKKKN